MQLQGASVITAEVFWKQQGGWIKGKNMRIYTDKRTCKDRQFYMDILPEVQLVTS